MPPAKPLYRIPSMEEIRAVEPNGYRVISTFSGCGGSCLGFKMAGFRVLYANEFVPAAVDTYRANHPEVYLDTRDVRTVTAEEIMNLAGVKRGEIDVLEGSPPCSDFSTAGLRSRSWGKVKAYSDTRQRSDDLFFEYVRLVEDIQPRVFLAENVSGLVKGVAKGYFIEIMRAFKAAGYRVGAKLLDAQWLGVPQARQRVIFIGVRSDVAAEPAWPKPFAYRYSVRDALPWIARGETMVEHVERFGTYQGDYDKQKERVWKDAGQPAPTIRADQQRPVIVETSLVEIEGANGFRHHEGESIDEPMSTVQANRIVRIRAGRGRELGANDPAPTVQTHGRRGTRSELTIEHVSDEEKIEHGWSLDGYAIGEEWDRTPPGGASSKYFSLKRPHPDRPSQTVTAGGVSEAGKASVTHPTERRKFSIAELRRICAFPDDFVFTGTYAQQWERMGRAVPPLMMRAVATTIRDEILRPANGR